MTRVKPHPNGWLAASLGVSTIAATVLMSVFSTGASASVAAHSHARAHAHAVHVSPFGTGATRSARHATRRPAAARPGVTTGLTEWVSNSVPVGHNTGCQSPGFSTISAALAVAPSGGTVRVCAGTYTDQLGITSPVSLKAQGAVTLVGLATPSSSLTSCDADGGAQANEDVVDICGPVSVTISGFTIEGNFSFAGCYNSFYGVAVLGGADLTMSNSTVENIAEPPSLDGCQGGVGIEVGLATGPNSADPGTATLTNDTVETYQKNGITVDGAGSSATIGTVTVTGAGPVNYIAQNGIQVSDGAGATITGSTITGNECNDTAGGCGPDGFSQVQSGGILVFDSGPTTVSSTTVSGNDIGAYNIEDYAWAYYTPSSPFTPVPVSFSGMGLANRYENAFFDQGESQLTSSRLSGGEVGIEVPQYSGQTAVPQDTTTGNTITGASQDAVLVASDQISGDEPVSLSATGSKFPTSNAAGVDNMSTSVVTATGDWWGAASGPSSWNFGVGSSVSADVNFFPWATNSILTHSKTCTTATTKITTGNNVVLCARAGTNAYLANAGTGHVLLIGNATGNDQLVGTSSTAPTAGTWIIGGTSGANTINGNNGTGYIQERGDTSDTVINDSSYTVATS